jgi:hypothetical protein
MTQQLMETTIREWVAKNPRRGARDLGRLVPSAKTVEDRSAQEVADALIAVARRHIAATRIW